MNEGKTKSFNIDKSEVYKSYQRVKLNEGSAGIDKESIDEFEQRSEKNLYKIWNRMSSGSYMAPAVKEVMISKKLGGERPLGIPTVGDRVAQGVIKDRLEAILEPKFHGSSYGYRPGKDAHSALRRCKENCFKYEWVIDLDIKGFFDNISHEWMIKFIKHHTEDKAIILYSGRWLKAEVEKQDGTRVERTKGTPQGGVISPLLANLYLHHAFDLWIQKLHSANPFERYADDIIVHCKSKEEAENMLEEIKIRLGKFDLEIHPDKTRIVYCKDDRRKGENDYESFTFLGYSFQPRSFQWKGDVRFTVFFPGIACAAKAFIKKRMLEHFNPKWTQLDLITIAKIMNPRIRGWLNYYKLYCRAEILNLFKYFNRLLAKWLKYKHRISSQFKLYKAYDQLLASNKELFIHWKLGITHRTD